MWQFAPNSVHYLLSLWQRMVASVPYIKATEPHMLETYTPEVTKAYITSRLDSVAVILRWEEFSCTRVLESVRLVGCLVLMCVLVMFTEMDWRIRWKIMQ